MKTESAHHHAGGGPHSHRLFGLLRALCLIFATYVVGQNIVDLSTRVHLLPGPGTLGAVVDSTGRFDDGFVFVKGVKPNTPMAQDGVVGGDQVRYDRTYDYRRAMNVGEHEGFTVRHAGRLTHHEAVVQPRSKSEVDWASLFYAFTANAIASLFGAFILWRGRNTTALFLGLALTCYGSTNIMPPATLSWPGTFLYFLVPNFIAYSVIPVLFLGFALGFYRDHVGPLKPAHRIGFWLYATVELPVLALACYCFMVVRTLPVFGAGQVFQLAAFIVGLALSLAYLVVGWRRSSASVQQRYALMLVAIGLIGLAQVYDSLYSFISEFKFPILVTANALLAGVVAPALLTYAILKRRVFDLGFAVNRTLVYGAVSAILLAAFGAVEWAVDHFIPIAGREKNVVVDALIAVCIYLTFHRLRDVVEHAVERVFFHRWQQADAAFRRFVKEAAYFTDSSALIRGLVQALAHYAEGAEVAVYLAGASEFARLAGDVEGVGKRLDPNIPGLLTVRSDLKAVEAHEGALANCLIAPMVTRNTVTGFVVLGPKPSGLNYRPDEVDLIGWGTRQVGLDLYALRVETLEKERGDLQTVNAQLERLLTNVSPRSPA
ncbi:MAG TPA: hypothetical protein VG407_10395 [Caulobacteraceae bacterium]|jgi:hypothetical protein|nr:hypothetical protein [Caulobacteraceae bacterium]